MSTTNTGPIALVREHRRIAYTIVAIGFAVLFAFAPYMSLSSGGILGGSIDSPGSLQILALCLTIGALAITYDVLMGYTGLVSFGHALFFAIGGYAFAMMLTHTQQSFVVCILVAIGATLLASIVLNAIALRSTAIAFSMVTLAFAQLANTIIGRNYLDTGGDNGIPLNPDRLPADLVGIFNVRYTYWMALALIVIVFAVAAWATTTRMGKVWQAIRENQLRVSVMGLNVYLYKLGASIVGSTLAGLCGVVYTIVIGTADPTVTDLFYSLGLVLMVIIGGRGRVWGAALGGVVYTLLQQRLPAIASSGGVSNLPGIIRVPLQGPQILIGIIFIVFILVIPGGLAELISRIPRLFGLRPGRQSAAPAAPADHVVDVDPSAMERGEESRTPAKS